jgi:hypothetical protein
VLAHDEVGQRSAVSLDVADEAQRHPGARLVLDPDDLRGEMNRLFARQIEIDLGGLARTQLSGRAHEQPVARDILDESVDDEAVRPKLSTHSDRDSNCCPLVHVVKATLATYQPESNPFYIPGMPHRGEILSLTREFGRTFSQEIAIVRRLRQIAAPK